MSAIFISHSSKDNAMAGEVKARLGQQGHRSIFFDFDPEDGIPAGRNWEKELYARLRGCQAVIVLCSEHSMASSWCFAEITQARSLGKHLFPLKVATCQISPLLADVQVTDLTLNLSEGYQRLWSGLKKVGLDPTDLFDWDGTRPPYPGLLAFQEQDAAVYFGRDADIQGTMEALNRQQLLGSSRLVLVLGASGSGKSSLVRAGVIPRLKRNKDRWLVLEPFRPLGRPFDELAMVLASAFASFGHACDWKSIRDALNPAPDNAGGIHLLDLANDLRVMAGQREATVLLVVDQFEELLGRNTNQSTSLFFRLLKAVLSQPSSPFLAVATLRSDFLGAFQIHEAVQDLLYEPIHLPQMALADFAQVIEGPARIAGVELEAGLAQAMVADTATDDALPLLAFTLRELWDRYSGDGRLTLEQYRVRLGGLQGSLARPAEAIVAERTLSLDEELYLRKAFLSMVRVDEEGRYVRRPAPWKELREDVHDLLERFVQARLLVSRSKGVDRILEVAHEALFRSWDRLVAWLNADREFLLWRQRLRGDLTEWERNEHDESMLLRGPALAEAERWLGERPDDLNPAEREFIEAGVGLREQERAARQRTRRRNRIIALGVIGILTFAALFAGWQWQRAVEQRNLAEAQQLATQADLTFAESDRYLERSALLASESMIRRHLFENDRALRRALPLSRRPIARLTHEGGVMALVFSPDGRTVATGSADKTARVFDAATGQELARLAHEGKVDSLAFSPDGRAVATGSDDGTARVFEAATGKELVRLITQGGGPVGGVMAVAFSRDGRVVATGGWDKTARVFDVASGQELARLTHENGVKAVAFSPDGRTVATGSADKTARVFDAATGQELARLTHENGVKAVAFSPDGRTVATGSADKTARVFDAATGQELARLTHGDGVEAVAFSPDGHAVATASIDGTARLFDAAAGKELVRLKHEDQVKTIAFSRDGRTVATGSWDDTARLFDVATGEELARLTHEHGVKAVAFSPDGRSVATGSGDLLSPTGDAQVFQVFETATGKQLARLSHGGGVLAVAFSPDGRTVATGSKDRTARLFDVATGKELAHLFHEAYVEDVAFTHDGRIVVTGSFDGTVRLFDVATGNELARFTQEDHVLAVAFSPDGRIVATGSDDGTARIFEAATGKELVRLITQEGGSVVMALAFSPDGRTVATGSTDKTARVFDVATGKELARLTHESGVRAVAFSRDGRTVATGSWDNTARVFDIATGTEHIRLPLEGSVMAVAFSPDGGYVAIGSKDRTGRLFYATTGKELVRLSHEDTVRGVAFSPDGRYMDTVSGSKDLILRRHLLQPKDLVDETCSRLTRNLTRKEWKQYVGDTPYQKTCPRLPCPPDMKSDAKGYCVAQEE